MIQKTANVGFGAAQKRVNLVEFQKCRNPCNVAQPFVPAPAGFAGRDRARRRRRPPTGASSAPTRSTAPQSLRASVSGTPCAENCTRTTVAGALKGVS